MRSKGLIGVFGLLILALLVLGVTYAYWNETLYITTTVHTGTFCVKFVEGYRINYDEPGDKDLKYYGYPERWPFDVGSTTCEVTEDTVTITLNNVYPCYQTFVRFRIKNCGTIPAKLKDVTVEFEDPKGLKDYVTFGVTMAVSSGGTNWVPGAWYAYPEAWTQTFAKTDAPLDELETGLEEAIRNALDKVGGVLLPGYEIWFDSLGFHIIPEIDEVPAPEDATLTIHITITWTQFNAPESTQT